MKKKLWYDFIVFLDATETTALSRMIAITFLLMDLSMLFREKEKGEITYERIFFWVRSG